VLLKTWVLSVLSNFNGVGFWTLFWARDFLSEKVDIALGIGIVMI
jgi:hypothetical protein